MKNKLILSLILPIIIHHTTNALPTKTPDVAGALVLGTGLVVAVGFKTLVEHDESNKITLGIGLASLAGSYLTYRYLKPLTIKAKLEKIQKQFSNLLKSHGK